MIRDWMKIREMRKSKPVDNSEILVISDEKTCNM